MLLNDLNNKYLNYAEVNHSKGTQSIYKTVSKYTLDIFGNVEIHELKKCDLERYKELRKDIVSIASVNKEMRSVKAIFNYATGEGFLDVNPFKKVKQLKDSEKKRKALNDEEVKSLLDCINNQLIKNIAIVGLATGCRLNEILWLRWRNVDLKSNIPVIRIENSEDFRTKNYENRIIPICDSLKDTLLKLQNMKNKQSDEFLFPNENGKPFNKSYISRSFKNFIIECGINKYFSFHCLRHTAITNIAKSNNNYKVIKEIAGHSNINTTMGYVHTDEEEKYKALNSLTYFKNKQAS